MKKEKITKSTNIRTLISKYPQAIEVFFEYGLQCALCPASAVETIEEGAQAHGFSEEKISNLIKRLNQLA